VFYNIVSRFDPWMKYMEDVEKLQARVQNLEALMPYLKISPEELEQITKKNKEKQNDDQQNKKKENDNQQNKEKEDDDDEDINLFSSDSEASEQA